MLGRPRTAALAVAVATAAAAALAAAACTQTDVVVPPVNDLACAAGELLVEGTIGGVRVQVREKSTGHGFINAVARDGGVVPGVLQATGANASFSFEFDAIVGSGQPAPARGFVRVGDPALDVGNCEKGPNDSAVSVTSGNPVVYRFTLHGARSPATCVGARVDGELRGCVGIGR